jgi:hypothetical protein
VYNFSKLILPEQHPFKRETSSFNGKPKRTQKPEIMTLIDWMREYYIEKGKE